MWVQLTDQFFQTIISQNDPIAQSIFVSGGKGASLALLKSLEKSGGRDFMSITGNEQLLDALVDVSSNPLKRNLKHKCLIHDGHQRRINRSGSVEQTQFLEHFGLNFEVPAFFVISTAVMNQHLNDNTVLMKTLHLMESVAYQRVDGDLKVLCEK